METIVHRLRELSTPESLKSLGAHQLIYPLPHPRYLEVHAYREAAILVSLIMLDGHWSTILIRRTPTGVHAGQIAFPGGAREVDDMDMTMTARREFGEEVGGPDVQIVSALSSLYIPVSDYMLYPYIGISTREDPVLIAQPNEVDEIIILPIETLIDLPITSRQITVGGQHTTVHGYEYGEYHIWGATAMVLCEFQILCKKAFEDMY